MSWVNLLSIIHHFMLEDAVIENNLRSEEEGLKYLIAYDEKPCTCPCHEEQSEQKEEKKYP